MTPYREFVKKCFRTFPEDLPLTVLHACVGIASEVSELILAPNRKNVREELGDSFFYLQALGNLVLPELDLEIEARGATLDHRTSIPSLHSALLDTSGEILDLGKKFFFYSIPISPERFHGPVLEYRTLLLAYSAACGLDPLSVISEHASKLSIRFPEGYSNAAAAVRLDKALSSQS